MFANLQDRIGVAAEARPSHHSLTTNELCALASDELVEVGAHSVNHSSLAALSIGVQKFEITNSKSMIERWIGKPISSFSYPFGGPADYSPETVRLVREAGFSCACANYPGTMTRNQDHFSMPRYLVRDWGADEFAERLAVWDDT